MYQVFLSRTEAEFLLDLLNDVGGDPVESARKCAQDLSIELTDVLGAETRRFARARSGWIEYANEPNLP